MDHSEQQHAHKNEPRLDSAPQATLTQPAPVATGDMPAWLSNPPAAPTAAQRWGRRVMFLGLAIVTVAVAGGATLLGLNLYESNSAMEVVSRNAPVAAVPAPVTPAAPLPFLEKRSATVPPLVLLPADPNAKKEPAPTATAAADMPTAESATVSQETPVRPESAPKVGAAPPPLLTQTPEKPVKAALPAKESKIVAAPKADKAAGAPSADKAVVAKPKPPVKKAAVVAKRPVPKAQANVKPVKGTMLQPPSERSDNGERADDAPARREAIDRRCQPGELARECAARIR